MQIPDDDDLELKALSIAYRSFYSRGDANRVESVLGESIDPVSGLVNSTEGLVPAHQAVRGRDYVVGAPHDPRQWAMCFLVRPDGTQASEARGWAISYERRDASRPGGVVGGKHADFRWLDKEKAEAEAEYLRKQHPDFVRVWVRETKGEEVLTPEELREVDALQDAWNRVFHRMAEKGWMVIAPPVPFEPAGPEHLPAPSDVAKYRVGMDDKKRIFMAHFSDEGLNEAIRRIAGHPVYSQPGPFSALEAAPPEVKDAAATSNPFQFAKWRAEKGGKGL